MNALSLLRHLALVVAVALMGLFTACSNKSSGDLSLNPGGCVEDEDESGDIDENDEEDDAAGGDDDAGECDDD